MKKPSKRDQNTVDQANAMAQALIIAIGDTVSKYASVIEPRDRPDTFKLAMALTLSAFFQKDLDDFCRGTIRVFEKTGPIPVEVINVPDSKLH